MKITGGRVIHMNIILSILFPVLKSLETGVQNDSAPPFYYVFYEPFVIIVSGAVIIILIIVAILIIRRLRKSKTKVN
jgi:hypothetical protein